MTKQKPGIVEHLDVLMKPETPDLRPGEMKMGEMHLEGNKLVGTIYYAPIKPTEYIELTFSQSAQITVEKE